MTKISIIKSWCIMLPVYLLFIFGVLLTRPEKIAEAFMCLLVPVVLHVLICLPKKKKS